MKLQAKHNIKARSHAIPMLMVFLIALFFRLYRLGSIPATFYVEEMTNTYVGKFILTHGKDIYGNLFPLLYFDKFGDFAPVLPLYLSGLSAVLLGVNEFAARFPIAIVGALFVIVVYKLTLLLFAKRTIAILTALIAALTPWHVVLSRTTAEGIVGLAIYGWALLWILRGITENNIGLVKKSFLLFFLTYFLYPGLRILTPLTLLPLPLLTWKTDKRVTKWLIGAMVVSFILTGYIATTPWGQARFAQTSLFQNPDMAANISQRSQVLANAIGPNKVTEARIFHNKYVLYAREFASQYLSYFSPRYLFLESGGQYRYYNVPDQGLLFLATVPLFLAALTLLARQTRPPLFTFVVYLLAISPLPSALTVDFVPHAHRSMFMILPLLLVAGGGIAALREGFVGKRLVIVSCMIFMIFETIYFWHQYTAVASSFQTMLRNDGDREMVSYIRDNRTNYDHVYAPVYERLSVYYLFYTNNFTKDVMGKFKGELHLTVPVDNVTFVEEWCASKKIPTEELTKNLLIVQGPNCPTPNGYQSMKEFTRKDGTFAYQILAPITR